MSRAPAVREEPGGALGRRVEEVALKLQRVRGWLEENDRSAALFTSQANFAWLTAGRMSHVFTGDDRGVASILVTSEAAYLISSNIELPRLVQEEIPGLPFEAIDHPWHEPEGLYRIAGGLCDLQRTVGDSRASDVARAGKELAALRYTLLAAEVDRYRSLGQDAASSVETACREARRGDRELDVAARVARECWRRDILPLVNLVAADGRIAAYRHPIPTENRLERTLLVALTGRRHGLHASLTRMVSLEPPDRDFASRYHSVQRVDARMILASSPPASLADVVGAGVDQYAREGFPEEWRLHHQGGLTGYAGREIFGTPAAGHRLEPYQALAWNPSITRVKSEDTVVIRDDGFEILTATGEWPVEHVEVDAGTVPRPSALRKGTT